jgi:hypothetical protein
MLIGVVVLASCGDNRSNGNPTTLWLGPDQNETHVKLVESPPDPY